jgi:hypothetical protein
VWNQKRDLTQNGEYVRPWVLVLNECGNRVSIMYLDTKTSKRQTSALLIQIRECSNSFTGHISMKLRDQASTADPVFQGQNIINTSPPSKNRSSIEHLPSRPAKELFEDSMNRLITLEWIPFNQYAPGIIHKGYREYEELKLLIQSYSWPETFDGAAFDAAAERWKGFDRVRSKAEEPVNKVEELQVNLNWNQDMLAITLIVSATGSGTTIPANPLGRWRALSRVGVENARCQGCGGEAGCGDEGG